MIGSRAMTWRVNSRRIVCVSGRLGLAVASEPKAFLSLEPPYTDAFGGHVDALYEHLDQLAAALSALSDRLGRAFSKSYK